MKPQITTYLCYPHSNPLRKEADNVFIPDDDSIFPPVSSEATKRFGLSPYNSLPVFNFDDIAFILKSGLCLDDILKVEKTSINLEIFLNNLKVALYTVQKILEAYSISYIQFLQKFKESFSTFKKKTLNCLFQSPEETSLSTDKLFYKIEISKNKLFEIQINSLQENILKEREKTNSLKQLTKYLEITYLTFKKVVSLHTDYNQFVLNLKLKITFTDILEEAQNITSATALSKKLGISLILIKQLVAEHMDWRGFLVLLRQNKYK